MASSLRPASLTVLPLAIRRRLIVNPLTGCWEWAGRKHLNGYVYVQRNGRDMLLHRWAWEAAQGVPLGTLTIDHTCRVRHCANPHHLQAVPHKINLRRARRFAHPTLCRKCGRPLPVGSTGRRCVDCLRVLALTSYYEKFAAARAAVDTPTMLSDLL